MAANTPLNLDELVDWTEARREGQLLGVEGLITEGCKHPYHVDIDGKGSWQVWHYLMGDKTKVIARGGSNNIAAAQRQATLKAIEKISGLKAYVSKQSDGQLEVQPGEQIHLEPSTGHKTLRMYAAVTTLVLWVILGSFYMLKYRPLVGTIIIGALTVGLTIAHQIIKSWALGASNTDKLNKQEKAKAIRKELAIKKSPQQGRRLVRAR
ncbi:MAG: hypothetical protein AAF267_17615 [Deinococcota bacterium]